MDVHPTPFPGKLRTSSSSNMKSTKKLLSENKKEAPFSRQKRVFGTSRNTNIPVKTTAEKPIVKPTTTAGISRQQPKTCRTTSVKPRVTQTLPISPKLVQTEKLANGVDVSSPTVNLKVDETVEIIDRVVVSSPAGEIKLDETEGITDGVVSSPVVTDKPGESEGLAKDVVSSPVVKPNFVEKEDFTQGVVPSAAVKGKSVEKEVSSNGSGSSPALKAGEKKPSGQSKSKSKKSVCFQQPSVVVKNGKEEMHTPILSSSSALIKPPNVSVTPYHSAERCSNCRLHKLESSSYWIAQIKLAESAEKHSVSATFFRLALECNAEPVRTLRIELRSYLARHGSLTKEMEWRNISLCYGLVKGESIVSRLSPAIEKAAGQEEQKLKDHCEEKELVQGIESQSDV